MQGFVVIVLILKIEKINLNQKLILRGFFANKLTWQFKKFSIHYNELLNKYQENYVEIPSEIFG